MPRKTKKVQPMKEQTRKHYKDILRALKEVLSEEHWSKTSGDKRLAELVRAKGVYATHVQLYNVRIQNNIGDAYERKVAKFAEQSRGK